MGDIASLLSAQGTREVVVKSADTTAHIRPAPRGRPFAWAESRQELCETLPYYKAYQSGCYTRSATTTSKRLRKTKDGTVERDATAYGYLLAGFGASRDAWLHDGRVIISHGGGKSRSVSSDDAESRMQLIEDQCEDAPKIASLIQSYKTQTPIVLLMAADYKLSHFQLPCAFAVLGWYWITDYWCEKEQGFNRFKFRFQYIEMQGSPWWLEEVGSSPSYKSCRPHLTDRQMASRDSTRAPRATWTSRTMIRKPPGLTCSTIDTSLPSDRVCLHCCNASPLVYLGGWMCLSPNCFAFWKLTESHRISYDFTLHANFTRLRKEPSHFALGGLPFSLLPPSNTDIGEKEPLQGLHCSCGRLNCRQYVGYWLCAHCGFVKQDTRGINQSTHLQASSTRCLDEVWINERANITFSIRKWQEEGIEAATFTMPDHLGGGRIHLIRSTSLVDCEVEAIFKAFKKGSRTSEMASSSQQGLIPFRRHALNCHTIKGAFLSQQFTCNYGAEYKHAVKMGTIPLQDAASCIKDALAFLHHRSEKVISEENAATSLPFNELYPVLYLESQKMNYHDDGEPGLDPVVSTLSLGVEAKMMFRLKEKYTVEGAAKLQDRSHAGLTMQDRLLLTIPLSHGSVLVQEGHQLQEMMEHAVHPQIGSEQQRNLAVRIAITARQINESK